MKMKLFAAAVAALAAGGAYAQSSVTLYGVVDAGIEYQNKQPAGQGASAGHSVTRLISGGQSGSRWGLRGVEDLGGGLKGVFVLESGFSVDTGATTSFDNRLFGRQAFVGLGSQYGQLTLGRHQTPMYDFGLQFDPMAIASNYSITAMDGAFSGRADNSLKYLATFGGLTVNALYSFGWNTGGQPTTVTAGGVPITVSGNNGEVPGTWKIGREYSLGLSYAAGPFSVGAVYDETNQGISATPDATLRRASLAGTYAFGPAKLFAGYRWAKGVDLGAIPFLSNVSLQAASGAKASSNLYWLGAGYQLTPAFSLTGAAYYQDFRGSKADPWLFVATADYALSKRTDAYLSLAYAYNRDNSNLGVQGFNKVSVDSSGKGDSQFGATVGIRHKF